MCIESEPPSLPNSFPHPNPTILGTELEADDAGVLACVEGDGERGVLQEMSDVMIFDGSHDPPDSGPNMHSFTGTTDSVLILDIVGPPYNDDRPCTYYREIDTDPTPHPATLLILTFRVPRRTVTTARTKRQEEEPAEAGGRQRAFGNSDDDTGCDAVVA
ncbi:hypothetical protein BJ742DRAFT_778568 [Cladochytrium replicatum]|nr:hypothetical protein BJ742DRAFT_778568 [Cladochytrium replicatum]